MTEEDPFFYESAYDESTKKFMPPKPPTRDFFVERAKALYPRDPAMQKTVIEGSHQQMKSIASALVGLYTAIERGLLGIPDMQIAGNHSTRFQLNWNMDRIESIMPTPWVLSLPQWIYHLLMLAWSLWLAFSLVSWLRWGWGCFSKDRLWMPVKWRRKAKPPQGKKTRQKDETPKDAGGSSALK